MLAEAPLDGFAERRGDEGRAVHRATPRRTPGESSGPAGCWGSGRVAIRNVNSAKQRLPRLLPWLDERQPDVVCLQETKLADAAFDELLAGELAARGYAVARHGQAQWNGVAILSRSGLEEVTVGIPGAPGFPHREARALSARCGGIRLHSVYVPNGRIPDSDHCRYKLTWLAALRDQLSAEAAEAIISPGARALSAGSAREGWQTVERAASATPRGRDRSG